MKKSEIELTAGVLTKKIKNTQKVKRFLKQTKQEEMRILSCFRCVFLIPFPLMDYHSHIKMHPYVNFFVRRVLV